MLERRYLCSCSPGSWIHNARYSVQMERRPTVGRHLERGGTTAVSRARSQATTFNHTPIYRQISPSYQFFLLNLVQRLAQMIMNNLLTCCNIILSHASCTRRYIRVRYVCGAVSCSFFSSFIFIFIPLVFLYMYIIYIHYTLYSFRLYSFFQICPFFFNLFVLFFSFFFWFFFWFSHRYAPITVLPYTVNTYRSFRSRKRLGRNPSPGLTHSTNRPIDQSINLIETTELKDEDELSPRSLRAHRFLLEFPFYHGVDDVLFHDSKL